MPQHSTGIGAQPRGDIHRHHRQPGGIDRVDRAAVRLAHVAGQTGAEQGVQHDAAQLGLSRPGVDEDFFRDGLGMGQCRVALQTLRVADCQHPH
ncbi:hypothetical protein D9M71_834820 [compost metagenome]